MESDSASDAAAASCSRARIKTKTSRRALPRVLKLAVWEKYIGNSTRGMCFVCERAPITIATNVEYGHVVAVANGGADTIENLRPICASCNREMGTRDLFEYKRALAASGIGADADAEMRIIARGGAKAAHPMPIAVGEIIAQTFTRAPEPPGTSSRILRREFADRDLFARLLMLTDAQIAVLSRALGIRERGSAARRLAIAARAFVLPRPRLELSSRGDIDALRDLVARADLRTLSMIFGSPVCDCIECGTPCEWESCGAGAHITRHDYLVRANALFLVGVARSPS